jgi:hypothetical protein
VHPGWNEFEAAGQKFFVGDAWLRENCKQSVNSSILRDYPYDEQLDMIKKGKEYLVAEFKKEPRIFVAGRWSLNNDTVEALIKTGFTHDLSAPSHSISDHYDWLKLPRIALPYHPSANDYQKEGDLSLLMVPIAQTLFGGTVSPEGIITYGLPWLLSCFKEYYRLGVPLFHICLHSPSMTDSYYVEAFEKILRLTSSYKNINFKFASEIKQYPQKKYGTNIVPYLFAINKEFLQTGFTRLKNFF